MINESFIHASTIVPLLAVIACYTCVSFGCIRHSAMAVICLSLSVLCLYFGVHRPIWLLSGFIFLLGVFVCGMIYVMDISYDWWRRKHPTKLDAKLGIFLLIPCLALVNPFSHQVHAFDFKDQTVRVNLALYVIDIADRAGKIAIRESLQDAQIPGELLQSPSSALEWLRAYGEPVSAFEDTAELLNDRYGHISHIRTVQYPQITYVTGSDGSPTDSIRELKFKPIRTGLSIDLEPSISDSGFSLLLDFSFSWLDGKVPNSVQDLAGPEPSLCEIKHRSTLKFADGESRVLFLDSVHPGRSVVLLLTGHLKRPSGDPAGLDGRLAQMAAEFFKHTQAMQE